MYGYNPAALPDINLEEITNPAVGNYIYELNECWKIAAHNIQQAQAAMASQANKSRQVKTFAIGDKVLLSTENLNLP